MGGGYKSQIISSKFNICRGLAGRGGIPAQRPAPDWTRPGQAAARMGYYEHTSDCNVLLFLPRASICSKNNQLFVVLDVWLYIQNIDIECALNREQILSNIKINFYGFAFQVFCSAS